MSRIERLQEIAFADSFKEKDALYDELQTLFNRKDPLDGRELGVAKLAIVNLSKKGACDASQLAHIKGIFEESVAYGIGKKETETRLKEIEQHAEAIRSSGTTIDVKADPFTYGRELGSAIERFEKVKFIPSIPSRQRFAKLPDDYQKAARPFLEKMDKEEYASYIDALDATLNITAFKKLAEALVSVPKELRQEFASLWKPSEGRLYTTYPDTASLIEEIKAAKSLIKHASPGHQGEIEALPLPHKAALSKQMERLGKESFFYVDTLLAHRELEINAFTKLAEELLLVPDTMKREFANAWVNSYKNQQGMLKASYPDRKQLLSALVFSGKEIGDSPLQQVSIVEEDIRDILKAYTTLSESDRSKLISELQLVDSNQRERFAEEWVLRLGKGYVQRLFYPNREEILRKIAEEESDL